MTVTVQAVLIILAASVAGGALYTLWRARGYVFAKAKKRTKVDQGVSALPEEIADAVLSEEGQALRTLFTSAHRRAKILQVAYHFAISAAASALLAGFFIFTLEASGLLAESHGSHLFATSADLAALILSFLCWIAARLILRHWLTQRAISELARQSVFLSSAPGLEATLTGRAQRIETTLRGQPLSALAQASRDLWNQLAQALHQSPLAKLPADIEAVFRSRRMEKQKGWFRGSEQRLERAEAQKSGLLGLLFLAAVAASGIKLALLLGSEHPSPHSLAWATFFFLNAIGLAAAMTALFVNQNGRTLIHVYRAHQTRIEGLISDWDSAKDGIGRGSVVVAFEEMMAEELCGFIEISRRDIIELSP